MIHENCFSVRIQIFISKHLEFEEGHIVSLRSQITSFWDQNIYRANVRNKERIVISDVSASLISLLRNFVLITSDISKRSFFLPIQPPPPPHPTPPHPPRLRSSVVKRKVTVSRRGSPKRMHGKLVIRYYCLYRNQLLSWTNPIPFVSIDHIIFHGPSRGWTYSELNPMCTSTSNKVQPHWM